MHFVRLVCKLYIKWLWDNLFPVLDSISFIFATVFSVRTAIFHLMGLNHMHPKLGLTHTVAVGVGVVYASGRS